MTTARFYDAVRPLFGGRMSQAQVDGINSILVEGRERGVPRQQLAYILATVLHETARTMQPVRETLADSDAKAKARLENAWRKGKLPWVSTPYWRDGYFGRGYVQLTWRDNYRKMGDLLGVDLEADPSLALKPDIALDILFEGMLEGLFTGRSLDDVSEPATTAPDFENDRAVVNGRDRAKQIAGYAETFYAALEGVDQGSAAPATSPLPPEKPAPALSEAALSIRDMPLLDVPDALEARAAELSEMAAKLRRHLV